MLVLLLGLLLAVQIPAVQNALCHKVLDSLQDSFGGRLGVGEMHLNPFGTLVMKDVSLVDDEPYDPGIEGYSPADTLLRVSTIKASFTLKGLLSDHGAFLRRASLSGVEVNVVSEPGEKWLDNFSRVLRADPPPVEPVTTPELFRIGIVEASDVHFTYHNFWPSAPVYPGAGINWNDIEAWASFKGHDLRFKDGKMSGTADHAEVREKSGYHVITASARAEVGMGKAVISGIHVEDGFSVINAPEFSMTYRNDYSFLDFENQVLLEGRLTDSEVRWSTIRYFTGTLWDSALDARIDSGHMKGYVSDFTVDDFVFTDLYSGVGGSVGCRIQGIPDVAGMRIDARAGGLNINTESLPALLSCFSEKPLEMDLGGIARGMDFIFDGRASGILDKMDFKGQLKGSSGLAQTEGTVRNIFTASRPLEVKGTVSTRELDAGRILGIGELGRCTLRAGAEAVFKGGDAQVRVDSLVVDKFRALGYDYTNLMAAGKFTGQEFNGKIICNDPNLTFLFQGIFNLSSRTRNAVYKFYANLGYADLEALHLDTRGGTSKVSGQVTADFMRIARGDAIGSIKLQNVTLEGPSGFSEIGDISLESHNNDNLNRLQLTSSFLDGGYVGSKSIGELIVDIQDLTTRRDLPALYRDSSDGWHGDDYDISLDFHDSMELLAFVMPGLYVADSTSLSLKIDRGGRLRGRLTSPRLAIGTNYLKGVDLAMDNEGSINCTLTSDEVRLSGIGLRDGIITGRASDNRFALAMHYDGLNSKDNEGEISIGGDFSRDADDSLVIKAHPHDSRIKIGDETWHISESEVVYDSSDLNVDGFRMTNGIQSLLVDGRLSATEKDTLRLEIKDVDLGLLNALAGKDMGFGGAVSGGAVVMSPARDAFGLFAALGCDSLSIGGKEAGALTLTGDWNKGDDRLNLRVLNSFDGKDALTVSGSYSPTGSMLDLMATMDSLDLAIASPLLGDVFSDMGGYISGGLSVNGPVDSLDLRSDGTRLDDAMLKLAFTNVPYTLNGPIGISSKGIVLDGVTIRDSKGGRGSLRGGMKYNRLNDLRLDAGLALKDMELLDSSNPDDGLYGNIFASGDFSLTGPMDAIMVSGDAVTSKKGTLHIPLAAATSNASSSILTFKEPELRLDPYLIMLERQEKVKKQQVRNDIAVKVRVNATPDLEAQLELDKESGNVISAVGNGQIALDIRPSQDIMNLLGDYNISSGKYHFSALGTLASKDFKIEDGSSVKFNGDVMDSEFDVAANFNMKTSLAALLSDTTSVSSRRDVICGIKITDKLKNPQLAFSIDIPDLDPTTQAMVDGALNTEDKVQKQFIALLLTGGFIPDVESGIFTNNSTILYSNLSGILSGQVNSILQKLDIPLDLGLSYTQNEAGTDIFNVAVSTQLFNNRVVVNGTIGNRQYSTNSNDEMVGDLDVEVKLDNSGQVRLNLFSHSADAYTSYLDNTQRNGIGVTYQKEFSNFFDFVKGIFQGKQREERLMEMQHEARDQVNIKIE